MSAAREDIRDFLRRAPASILVEVTGAAGSTPRDTDAFMLVSERTLAIHKTAASVDPLTGLLNRRGFGEATARMIEREAKAGRSITVMIFDIDHFKSVNDTYGHPVGDDVLKVFANVAVGALRITDLLGRVGGEEFAALLPCAMDEALLAAERVRDAFEQSGVAIDGAPLATTVTSVPSRQ